MDIYGFEALGYEGQLVKVEVNLRRGIPGMEIIGLPDGAIREARDRIRAALSNAGFQFPLEKLLVNLAPAGLRKAGASFDLAIAWAILVASGQAQNLPLAVLAMGELELSGRVRAVAGVLPAVGAAVRAGLEACVVPAANLREAAVLASGHALAIGEVRDLVHLRQAGEGRAATIRCQDAAGGGQPQAEGACPPAAGLADRPCLATEDQPPDMADIRGQERLRRGLEICAAGGHHLLLFGPPGSGKTMAARRLPGILPDLSEARAIETTKIHSLAGVLPANHGLLRRPVFREPHHSASLEGLIGGGRALKPGEVSLAHGGALFLDEAAEFRSDALQALREPLESGQVSISRADSSVRYPSAFILVLACNPCPCGNLGREQAVCLCSSQDIRRYWRRLGAALLDRVDIRIPVQPCPLQSLLGPPGEPSAVVGRRVLAARAKQSQRAGLHPGAGELNGRLPVAAIERFCRLGPGMLRDFQSRVKEAGVSARAWHSILRMARTIADLAGFADIGEEHLGEALAFRQYGDEDWFWQLP